MPATLTESADAFSRAFRFLFLLRVKSSPINTSPPALALCSIVALISVLLAEYSQAYSYSSFWLYGFAGKIAVWALFALLAAVATGTATRGRLTNFLAIALAIASIVNFLLSGASLALSYAAPQQYNAIPWPFLLFASWQTLASFRLAHFVYGHDVRFAGVKLALAGFASALLLPASPILAGTSDPRAFVDIWNIGEVLNFYSGNQSQSGGENQTSGPASADVEDTYYKQQPMMSSLLANIERSEDNPGAAPRVFFLGLAPDGSQSVFKRELLNVRGVVEEQFGSKNRSLVLINSEDTLQDLPLANISNFRIALAGLAERMNTDKDTLLLYISTHGAPDMLSVYLPGYRFQEFSANALAEAITNSKIKNIVAVVSACYSGSLIDEFEGPNRIVITAASADRTSFGCSNDRDWTYFGDAFFNHALRQTTSFPKAFEIARRLVGEWEKRDGITPSDPQISIGASISRQMSSIPQ